MAWVWLLPLLHLVFINIYYVDMRNMRNWERYPEKIFTEEGKGRVESFPKIDAIRVSQPPWYGY